MANELLNSLLKEYEHKKMQAELDLEKRKELLYKKIPRLSEIESELNHFAIQTTKNILNNNSNSLNELYDKVNILKNEKAKILKENNITEDYLKPFYECKICNDTGYIQDNNYKTTMCSCLKQKLLDISFNEANVYNIRKENFDSFNENLFSDKCDASRYKFDISPRENIINIKNKCKEFIKNFDDINSKNLLFTGSTGLR